MQEILDLVKTLLPLFQNGAYAAGSGTLLMALVRIYRLGAIQNLLPKRARWDSLPPLAKVAVPFLLSLAGSLLVAVGGGATVLSSLPTAFIAALAAIGLHHGTKALGQMMTNSALKARGPSYTPSKWRDVASIVVPIGKIPNDVFNRTP